MKELSNNQVLHKLETLLNKNSENIKYLLKDVARKLTEAKCWNIFNKW